MWEGTGRAEQLNLLKPKSFRTSYSNRRGPVRGGGLGGGTPLKAPKRESGSLPPYKVPGLAVTLRAMHMLVSARPTPTCARIPPLCLLATGRSEQCFQNNSKEDPSPCLPATEGALCQSVPVCLAPQTDWKRTVR